METQKNQNSQYSIEGEEQSWRIDIPWLQGLLKVFKNQDSVVVFEE